MSDMSRRRLKSRDTNHMQVLHLCMSNETPIGFIPCDIGTDFFGLSLLGKITDSYHYARRLKDITAWHPANNIIIV